MREMLYEAAFWRGVPRPPMPQDLARPDLAKLLRGWGERHGDCAVIGCLGPTPVGAAWYRFWPAADRFYGFVDETTPEIALAVRPGARNQGIGHGLLAALIKQARAASVTRLSLSVAKQNAAARRLYMRQRFVEVADTGDAMTMLWQAEP